MTLTEQKLKTLVLGPQDHRSTEMLDILGQPAMVKLAGSDTNDAVAVLHVTVPKMSGPPLHRHSREDEWFYVLDGEVTFEVDGQRLQTVSGCSAFAPRGTVHTFQNFSDTTAHMIVLVTPAGLDRFFEEVTTLNKGLSQPDLAGTEKLMNNYGVEMLGPPLT
jgi:quercetin dioxygenase-like cupin family protein